MFDLIEQLLKFVGNDEIGNLLSGPAIECKIAPMPPLIDAAFRAPSRAGKLAQIVADRMSKRGLGHFAREVCLVAAPIAKRRAEPVNCEVARPMRRKSIAIAMLLRLNRRSPVRGMPARVSSAAPDKGTQCGRLDFMRSAGTVQVRAPRSNSG